jgi:hypothetical protein
VSAKRQFIALCASFGTAHELPAKEFSEPVDHSSIADAQEQAVRFFRRHLELIKREVC